MNKCEAAAFITVFVMIFGGLLVGEYQEAQVNKTAIEAGLEQCIIDSGLGTSTIWVKDCRNYKENR